MRKFFLDCGSNMGQSIIQFKKTSLYSPDFIIYTFEPNPRFLRSLVNRPDIVFLNKAVWIKDEERDFYISKSRKGGQKEAGSSLKIEKFSGKMDQQNPISVECFDFSKWLIDNFTKDDYIILKMDIEGAEYDVLNKMVKDGSIFFIKKAFIEFHAAKMHIDISAHDDLIKKLNNIKGLELLPEMSRYFGVRY